MVNPIQREIVIYHDSLGLRCGERSNEELELKERKTPIISQWKH